MGATEVEGICRELGLEMSAKTAKLMLADRDSLEELHGAILQLANTIMLEMKDRKFDRLNHKFIDYYENQKLFGQTVFDGFSSANDDIYEAGACLALERPTACVLHLMRVLEAGLAALAKTVGVTKQNDWGRYLKEIDAELERRAKAAGARSADEQFYTEAAVNFDRLRRAYRNPTMHPDKSYSQDRAEEILLAVKSFMTHLATKISE